MNHVPRTLIAVATYNEIENLPRLVAGIGQHLPDADILVIDDGSPDGTGRWCDERAASDSQFQVIHRPRKLGLGTATLAGLRFAIERDYDFVVTMDADLSHDPAYLPELLAAATDPGSRCDLSIGSRYVAGGGIDGWPWTRRVMSRCINWYARWMLGLKVHDCSGAYRCFRVAFLREIDLESMRSQGYSLLEEMLWVLDRRGARMCEIPIVFVDRMHGRSKISYREALAALWIIFQLSWKR